MEFPTHLELVNPLLRAMRSLGSSGSIDASGVLHQESKVWSLALSVTTTPVPSRETTGARGPNAAGKIATVE